MTFLSPSPSEMFVKIAASVEPYSHLASVRSCGLESFGARGPSPLAVIPWQNAQCFLKMAAPAAIEAAVEGTGFLIAGAVGVAPPLWAWTATANNTAPASMNPLMNRIDTRR